MASSSWLHPLLRHLLRWRPPLGFSSFLASFSEWSGLRCSSASVWQQSSDSTWSGLQRSLASVPQVPSRSSASSLPIISFPLRFSFNAWPGLRRILASVRQQSPNFLCLTGTTSQFGFSPAEIFGFHSWPGLRRSLASVRQFPVAVFSLDQR